MGAARGALMPLFPGPTAKPAGSLLSSGGFEIDPHAATQGRRDVHQRVEREARDTAAQEIVDPWLRYAAMFRRFGLCPVVLFQTRHKSSASVRTALSDSPPPQACP